VILFGIDPGSAITGFGAISVSGNSVRWIDSGVVRVGSREPLAKRLHGIYQGLTEKLSAIRPDVVSIEEAFYAKNARTALVLGEARGVALLAATQSGARIVEYAPRAIKKALVGNGQATKEQVGFMVTNLLTVPPQKAQTDACDALAAALCAWTHAHTLKI